MNDENDRGRLTPQYNADESEIPARVSDDRASGTASDERGSFASDDKGEIEIRFKFRKTAAPKSMGVKFAQDDTSSSSSGSGSGGSSSKDSKDEDDKGPRDAPSSSSSESGASSSSTEEEDEEGNMRIKPGRISLAANLGLGA